MVLSNREEPYGQFNIHCDSQESSLHNASLESIYDMGLNSAAVRPGVHPMLTSKLDNQISASDRAASSSKECVPCVRKSSPTNVAQDLLSYFSSESLNHRQSTTNLHENDTSAHHNEATEQNKRDDETGCAQQATSEYELERLRLELQTAKDEIARMDRQLSQSRHHDCNSHHLANNPTQNDLQIRYMAEHIIRGLHSPNISFQPSTDTGNLADAAFMANISAAGDESAPTSTAFASSFSGPGRSHSLLPSNRENVNHQGSIAGSSHSAFGNQDVSESASFAWSNAQGLPLESSASRRASYNSSPGLVSNSGSNFSGWGFVPHMLAAPTTFSPSLKALPYHPGNATSNPAFQPRPMPASLSPTALEFQAAQLPTNSVYQPNSWSSQSYENAAPSYVNHLEPLNYRRLLDKNVTCNWKYIVDKIVCSNDQQASIFLQQKLKIASPEQKFELVEAIIAQAYPLMVNRFGNFLVQRCLEHGTPEQVVAIANAIRGNTLALSMDPFGCHVVQKAFDAVPEDYKAIMVHELLRNIPETVIHRYACHVWQKLFELRWSDSPPQIMKYVNEALQGMWHEVALGETGSLVVQNIFENCLEEDKRPCIEEVIGSIDIVSHGQFGNWCIQHICEHGAPADKSRAISHVLRFATEYSTDQFASKVVEKCLKVGGADFLEQYLERVCEGRPDRPRMPLIDIAGDQYGNYLIQYILTNSATQHRETVAQHVRKHMVSLRGSKFGSRVAMLCSNPAFATRPGPAVSVAMAGRLYHGSSGGQNAPVSRSGMSAAPYR